MNKDNQPSDRKSDAERGKEELAKKILHAVGSYSGGPGEMTAAWSTNFSEDIALGSNADSRPLTTKDLSGIQLVDKIMDHFQRYSFEFSQKYSGPPIPINCQRPMPVRDQVSNFGAEQVQFQAYMSTRSWGLVLLVSSSKISIYIAPAEFIVGFSTHRNDFPLLIEVKTPEKPAVKTKKNEPADEKKDPEPWETEGMPVSNDLLSIMAKKLFARLIRIETEQVTEHEPFSLKTPEATHPDAAEGGDSLGSIWNRDEESALLQSDELPARAPASYVPQPPADYWQQHAGMAMAGQGQQLSTSVPRPPQPSNMAAPAEYNAPSPPAPGLAQPPGAAPVPPQLQMPLSQSAHPSPSTQVPASSAAPTAQVQVQQSMPAPPHPAPQASPFIQTAVPSGVTPPTPSPLTQASLPTSPFGVPSAQSMAPPNITAPPASQATASVVVQPAHSHPPTTSGTHPIVPPNPTPQYMQPSGNTAPAMPQMPPPAAAMPNPQAAQPPSPGYSAQQPTAPTQTQGAIPPPLAYGQPQLRPGMQPTPLNSQLPLPQQPIQLAGQAAAQHQMAHGQHAPQHAPQQHQQPHQQQPHQQPPHQQPHLHQQPQSPLAPSFPSQFSVGGYSGPAMESEVTQAFVNLFNALDKELDNLSRMGLRALKTDLNMVARVMESTASLRTIRERLVQLAQDWQTVATKK